jgi:hypothetical protein
VAPIGGNAGFGTPPFFWQLSEQINAAGMSNDGREGDKEQ